MKQVKLIIFLSLSVTLFSSCKKFLDDKPKGIIIAETINDYESVLNGTGIVNPFGLSNFLVNVTDDPWQMYFSLQDNASADANLYFWREYINYSADKSADIWGDLYSAIANLNLITEGVMDASDGSEAKKKQVYAEAMVNKAFMYFHLLSYFAPAYDVSTADADFGVPYITSTDISQAPPSRPSLQESYDQLIDDLVKAIPDLPSSNINKTRVTKETAYAMLSRIYMSMRDYANAEKYADMVLNEGKSAILDYNDFLGDALPATISSPEELFIKYTLNYFGSFVFSDDLLSKFDLDKDLRIAFFAEDDGMGNYEYSGGNPWAESYNPNMGITYAEIYLNKAECLARAGKKDDAMDFLNNELRVNRFSPTDYAPLAAATTEEAIANVLEERRRELAFKGIRWSDMKRLDKEGRMPPVERIAMDGSSVLTTLEPGSKRYTFQIPLAVQAFNPQMPLNK